jgi:hypothetical protein
MRKLAVAFLLALTSLVANAEIVESNKPVVCSDVKTVIENISSVYNESPYWIGAGNDSSKYVLMVNSKTKTWTIIQFNDKIACVIGTGSRGNLINLGENI